MRWVFFAVRGGGGEELVGCGCQGFECGVGGREKD